METFELPDINQLLAWHREFYAIISTWEKREWGMIGANPQNPTSHDSNHAYVNIKLTTEQLPEILLEIKEWYSNKNLQPRLRFFIPPNDMQPLQCAESLGWNCSYEAETWRAWPCSAGCEPLNEVEGLKIEIVSAEHINDQMMIDTEGADEETSFRQRKVWETLSRNEKVECILGYIHGEPAASLYCIWQDGWSNVDGVVTREKFRCRGICHALIRFVRQRALQRGNTGLYLYHVEEGPGRIYGNAGFLPVATVQHMHMWLDNTR